MKLEEVYSIWLPEKKRQVKPTSVSTYVNIYNIHIRPKFGQYEIGDIARNEVRSWVYEKLDNTNLSIHYLKDMLIVLKMLLHYAYEELDQKIDKTEWRIQWPTTNKSGKRGGVKAYTKDEAKRITSYLLAHPSFKGLGILISLCGGLRIGEVAALKWEDIDIDQKVIHVNKTLTRIYYPDERRSEISIGTTKTTSSTRKVPIAKNLLGALKKFKAVTLPSYYVITGTNHFSEGRTYRHFYVDVVKKAGIDKVLTYHALRHTFATTMIDNGANVKAVSEILGHSEVATTMNLYVHPSDDAKNKALNKAIANIF